MKSFQLSFEICIMIFCASCQMTWTMQLYQNENIKKKKVQKVVIFWKKSSYWDRSILLLILF